MALLRFTIVQSSFFNGLNRFWQGENIEPQANQLAELGFNTVRTWTAYHLPGVGDLDPRLTPEVYDAIPAYHAFLARYGIYVELTAIAGLTWNNDAEMVRHWETLKAKTHTIPNSLLEVFNEYNNSVNPHPDPMLFLRPVPQHIASHGSNVQDSFPVEPLWNVATYRPGSNEWQRKPGHNAMEDVADKTGVPTYSNETIRCPDADTNPEHFQDAGAGAALLSAGCCFHSTHGKLALPFQPPVLGCARAFANGMHSVPLEFQAGRYVRIVDPDYLRVYRRVLPDGRYHEVRVRF